ncbi:MAG: phage holin family protein [bacterium]
MITELVIKSVAVFITSYILSRGIKMSGFLVAVVVAIILGALNVLVKPLLLLLTLPVNILSLGLFTFVVNAIIVEITAFIVPGFSVSNFVWAILFSVVLSTVNVILNVLL